ALDVGGDRLAKRPNPLGGGVVRHPLVNEGASRGILDMPRGVEVRLTNLEMDHAASGRLERASASRRLEGGLGPDPVHAAGKSHQGSPPEWSSSEITRGSPESVPMAAQDRGQ